MTILKRRKEGLDSDRWSRSPSPLPHKYKPAKRKSLSPLPPIRRSSPLLLLQDRKQDRKRPSRSPPHIRRGDTYNHRSTGHSSNNNTTTSRPRPRSRDRDRVQDNGRLRSSGGGGVERRNRTDRRTRSKSPANKNRSKSPLAKKRSKSPASNKYQKESPKHKSRKLSDAKEDEQRVERRREREKKSVEKQEPTRKIEEKPEKMEESPKEEEPEDESVSSDSESSSDSDSEAIDLFASEESESENEGRFKCSSRPAADKAKVPFSSNPRNKKDLAGTVLPDGDSKGEARFGDRSRRNPRNDRDRPRGSFKSSFREIDSGG